MSAPRKSDTVRNDGKHRWIAVRCPDCGNTRETRPEQAAKSELCHPCAKARARKRSVADASGACECGCGLRTPLAKRTNTPRGQIKGRPLRFVPGHQGRAPKIKGPRWEEEERGYSTPCWTWQLSLDGHGYGQWKINYEARKAHRVVYQNVHGTIPEGLELDHLCRNRDCVNPDHLEPVTRAENARRSPLVATRLHEQAVADAGGIENALQLLSPQCNPRRVA